jgi:hypothetical protein
VEKHKVTKVRYLKLGRETASTAMAIDVLRISLEQVEYGDVAGAFDRAKELVTEGKAPRYVDAPPGTVGRRRYDDSEALAMIADLEKVMPSDEAIAQTAAVYGVNESTKQRWRRRRREK